jgi:hypothetical protein
MYSENKPEMQCTEFEALLADAFDGMLAGDKQMAFELHRQSCANCRPLYAEARLGLRWLQALKTEQVEPPARLMENILRVTSWAELPGKEARRPWWQRIRELPVLAPVLQTVLQPRFAMSFAMAFFSVSAILTLTGVKLRDLRYIDLRPSAVIRSVYETRGKVVKYYENIRFVYEFESQVRDLKRATTVEEPNPQPEPPKEPKDRSGQPDKDKYRNYSLDESRPLLAGAHGAPFGPGVPEVVTPGMVGWQDRRYL